MSLSGIPPHWCLCTDWDFVLPYILYPVCSLIIFHLSFYWRTFDRRRLWDADFCILSSSFWFSCPFLRLCPFSSWQFQLIIALNILPKCWLHWRYHLHSATIVVFVSFIRNHHHYYIIIILCPLVSMILKDLKRKLCKQAVMATSPPPGQSCDVAITSRATAGSKLLRCPILRLRHNSRINVKFGTAEGTEEYSLLRSKRQLMWARLLS